MVKKKKKNDILNFQSTLVKKINKITKQSIVCK